MSTNLRKAQKHMQRATELLNPESQLGFGGYEGDNLPKGKKSYGVSFYFQDHKKTLTDKYVDKVMSKLQKQFESDLGAQLR